MSNHKILTHFESSFERRATRKRLEHNGKKFTSEEKRIPIRVRGGGICSRAITEWQVQLFVMIMFLVIPANGSSDDKTKPKIMSD